MLGWPHGFTSQTLYFPTRRHPYVRARCGENLSKNLISSGAKASLKEAIRRFRELFGCEHPTDVAVSTTRFPSQNRVAPQGQTVPHSGRRIHAVAHLLVGIEAGKVDY